MKERYRSIDIIKGIAMIMVILVHYGQNFSFDSSKAFRFFQMGCPVFFVASGFGIMCLVNKNSDGRLDKEGILKFYASRLKALIPGWYIAFFITYLINTVLLCTGSEMLSFGTNRDGISIVCNLLFLNGLLPFCNNNVMPGGWYVGTTVILYILTPFILEAIGKAKNKFVFVLITSALGMTVWVILYVLFGNTFCRGDFDYYFFLVHYPEYMLGILLYYDLSKIRDDRHIIMSIPISMAALIFSVVLFYLPEELLEIPSAWLIGLATFYLLRYMLYKEQERIPETNITFLEKIGRNSYYIYLLHFYFAWTFTSGILKICEKHGIPEEICVLPLIPVVLILAYFAGSIFHTMVNKLYVCFDKIKKG